MNEREALKLALELLASARVATDLVWKRHDVVEAIKEALAQPKQEPAAWELRAGKTDRVLIEITNNPQRAHDWKASLEEVVPLYTTPPQRKPEQESDDLTIAYMAGFYDGKNKYAPQPKPLTDEQLIAAYESEQQGRYGDHIRSLRAIEAAHGIKGE